MSTLNIPKLNLALQEQDLKNTPSQEQVGEVIVDESFQAEEQVKKNLNQEVQLEQPGSLKRKQMSAIASFFDQPVSIGALAGQALAGIFGGSQAGAAATPIALEFNKLAASGFEARRNRESREFRSSALQTGKLNQNLVHATTGETLQVIGGRVLDQNGKPVPVNLQKNLLDTRESRLKNQGDERIDIAKDRTEIARENLKLSTDKFIDKKDEDADKKRVQLVKQVESNSVYKKAQDQLTAIDEIEPLLDDALQKGGPSLSILGPKIAKGIAGEVGVLTEQDVIRYIENPAIVPKIADKIKKTLGGKLTANSGENIRRLLNISKTAAQRRSDTVIDKLGSRYSKTTKDISKEDATEIFNDNNSNKPASNEPRVTVYSRDGKAFTIPRSQLGQALRSGYKENK